MYNDPSGHWGFSVGGISVGWKVGSIFDKIDDGYHSALESGDKSWKSVVKGADEFRI